MLLNGWGLFPTVDAIEFKPQTIIDCQRLISEKPSLIARGFGRSYGDSSLAPQVMDMRALNHFLAFDEMTGIISCYAGISIHELFNLVVPKGWFLPVTPGTQYVSVGGMIASDVHGKNHHHEGTISEHLLSLQLLLGDGSILSVSSSEHADLFRASCGGMGLTGIILSATLKLKPISSSTMKQTLLKSDNFEHSLEQFEAHRHSSYSVAWLDCMSTGKHFGRSILSLGEHAHHGSLSRINPKTISIPMNCPHWLMNRYSVKIWNALHFGRRKPEVSWVKLDSFFYPLDKIINWNRLYGQSGLIQYQFVLPKDAALTGLRQILNRIAQSGESPFLAVLKRLGNQNQNILSFPIEGYTLALDFKVSTGLMRVLNELDKMVLDYGGRIYLTKDSRMSEDTFKSSYCQWQTFENIRKKYHAIGQFSSLQSKRLGLQ